MRLKNKNIGARVIIDEITVAINPKDKWKTLKKLSGVLVDPKGIEMYYHQCNGNYENVRKRIIESSWRGKYAIKLDNDVVDVEGNNIIRVDKENLTFLDYLDNVKIISKAEYNRAMKVIKEYDYQQTLK